MLVMSFSASAGICIFLVHCWDSPSMYKQRNIGHMGVGTLSSQKQFSNKLLDMLILGCLL